MTDNDKAREVFIHTINGNAYVRYGDYHDAIESQRRTIDALTVGIKNRDFIVEEVRNQASKSLGDAMKIIEEKDAEIERLTPKAVGYDVMYQNGLAQKKQIEQLQSRVKELEAILPNATRGSF